MEGDAPDDNDDRDGNGGIERARQIRARYLEGTLKECEEQLAKLGKRRDAWRLFEVIPDGTPRPGRAHGSEANEALGKEWKVIKRAKRPLESLPSRKALERAAEPIRAAEGLKKKIVDGSTARNSSSNFAESLLMELRVQQHPARGLSQVLFLFHHDFHPS